MFTPDGNTRGRNVISECETGSVYFLWHSVLLSYGCDHVNSIENAIHIAVAQYCQVTVITGGGCHKTPVHNDFPDWRDRVPIQEAGLWWYRRDEKRLSLVLLVESLFCCKTADGVEYDVVRTDSEISATVSASTYMLSYIAVCVYYSLFSRYVCRRCKASSMFSSEFA